MEKEEMQTIVKLFGERLRGLLDEKGVSNEEFAKAVGVSARLIKKWCEGSSQPRVNKLILIAKYFHVRADFLFGLAE